MWKVICIAAALAAPDLGRAQVIEEFGQGAETRWSYVTDGVMGGVSRGQARLEDGAVRLTGTVSTDNNGGFLQVQRRIEQGLPAGTQGLRLETRGNGARYYIFLRTRDMARPWLHYRAAFTAGADWAEVTLPLADFAPSRARLPTPVAPEDVISIGIVAYGRDHVADVLVRRIETYPAP